MLPFKAGDLCAEKLGRFLIFSCSVDLLQLHSPYSQLRKGCTIKLVHLTSGTEMFNITIIKMEEWVVYLSYQCRRGFVNLSYWWRGRVVVQLEHNDNLAITKTIFGETLSQGKHFSQYSRRIFNFMVSCSLQIVEGYVEFIKINILKPISWIGSTKSISWSHI